MSKVLSADAIAKIERAQEAHADAMRAIFNEVCDPADWKGPISVTVPAGTKVMHFSIVDAVTFMTATSAWVTPIEGGGFHIQSQGYRLGPAGDH